MTDGKSNRTRFKECYNIIILLNNNNNNYNNNKEILSRANFLLFHRDHVVIKDDKLEFKTVRMEEDGVYQCVAESRLGMIVSSTWINIRGN